MLKSDDIPGSNRAIPATSSPAPDDLKKAVCLVRMNRVPGTGFLIAPDVVLTTYHLLEPAPDEHEELAKNVRISFHYGSYQGDFGLADTWCLAKSRPEELDYVLLRLNGSPGRPFIKPATQFHPFDPGTPLHIIQHPNGCELKVAHQHAAVICINQARTRVQYRTWTRDGSSGSPCFNKDWALVALHHGTDPSSADALYNEGIPIDAIRESLPPGIRRELGW